MRMNEIASAEEQMALWKLISNNVWQSISKQVADEKKKRANAATQRKVKPKAVSKRVGGNSVVQPLPLKPLPSAQPSAVKQPHPQHKSDVGQKPMQQIGGGMNKLQPKSANPQQLNAIPITTKALDVTQQQSQPSNLMQSQLLQPTAAQQPLSPTQMRLQRHYVANNAKTSAVAK
jgi:hypothetical protein